MSDDAARTAEAASEFTAEALERQEDYRPPLSVTRPEILRDGSDSAFRELIWGLLVVAKRLQKYPEIFGRRIGVSSAQYAVLIATAHTQGRTGIGIRALAEYMHLPAPHITTSVGRLVEAGLLAKRQNPADGRGVLITMTKAGEAALRELAPFQQQINDVLFSGLSRQDYEIFTEMVRGFLDSSERALLKVAELERAGPAPVRQKQSAPNEAAE